MNLIPRIFRHFSWLQGMNIPAVDQRDASGRDGFLLPVHIKIGFAVQQIVHLNAPVPVLQNHVINLSAVQAKLHRHLLTLHECLMIK